MGPLLLSGYLQVVYPVRLECMTGSVEGMAVRTKPLTTLVKRSLTRISSAPTVTTVQ